MVIVHLIEEGKLVAVKGNYKQKYEKSFSLDKSFFHDELSYFSLDFFVFKRKIGEICYYIRNKDNNKVMVRISRGKCIYIDEIMNMIVYDPFRESIHGNTKVKSEIYTKLDRSTKKSITDYILKIKQFIKTGRLKLSHVTRWEALRTYYNLPKLDIKVKVSHKEGRFLKIKEVEL